MLTVSEGQQPRAHSAPLTCGFGARGQRATGDTYGLSVELQASLRLPLLLDWMARHAKTRTLTV